jgi:hypothetical protein
MQTDCVFAVQRSNIVSSRLCFEENAMLQQRLDSRPISFALQAPPGLASNAQ